MTKLWSRIARPRARGTSLARAVLASLFRSAFVLGLLLAVGCSPAADDGDPAADADPVQNVGEVLYFFDYAGQAQLWGPLDQLDFASPEDYRYLPYGWNEFERSEADAPSATTAQECAVIQVPCVQSSDLRISFTVALPSVGGSRGRPADRMLELRWNGTPIGFKLDPKPARQDDWKPRGTVMTLNAEPTRALVNVPASSVRVGMNQLELIPSLWESAPSADGVSPVRSSGLRISGLRIETARSGLNPGPHPRLRAEEGALIQPAGTLATFYFPLSADARFASRLRLLEPDTGGDAPSTGTISVIARAGDGADHLLFAEEIGVLREKGAVQIEADLAALAGRMAGFHFAYSAPSPDARAANAAWPELEWSETRIEQTRSEEVSEPVAPNPSPLNVMVILFDTLRADFTEPYGGKGTQTPGLAGLARRGVVFSNAYSTSSWTLPAVTSLFSSLYPYEHGYQSYSSSLKEGIPWLPEILNDAGYATTGIFGNPRLSPEWGGGGLYRGFDRTFSHFYLGSNSSLHPSSTTPEGHADLVWENFVEPSIRKARDAPFFIYLHEFDPHPPYHPRPPYDAMYDQGAGRNLFATLPQGLAPMMMIRNGRMHLRTEHVAQLEALYKGEVSFMDAYLSALLDRLRKAGLEENTLIVFLSDHGEEFMEHDMIGHGEDLWDTMLRVPLIFSLPGVLPEGTRIERTTDLVDVAPLILGLLGIETPASMRGDAAAPLFDNSRDPGDSSGEVRPLYATLRVPPASDALPRPRVESVRYGEWKLIRRTPDSRQPEWSEHRLFRPGEDPDEVFNLWAAEPVVGNTLRQMLDHELASTDREPGAARTAPGGMAPSEELPEAVRRQIEALGYVAQ